jgi:hypothetical protein
VQHNSSVRHLKILPVFWQYIFSCYLPPLCRQPLCICSTLKCLHRQWFSSRQSHYPQPALQNTVTQASERLLGQKPSGSFGKTSARVDTWHVQLLVLNCCQYPYRRTLKSVSQYWFLWLCQFVPTVCIRTDIRRWSPTCFGWRLNYCDSKPSSSEIKLLHCMWRACFKEHVCPFGEELSYIWENVHGKVRQ